MRLLLDSHVVLWWMVDDQALGPVTRAHISEADEVYFSAVTPWELGIKRSLGKLLLPDGALGDIESAGFSPLSISPLDGERAAGLPLLHRDPFDRMLVAQASGNDLTLVSADRRLGEYDVTLLDART